MLISFLFGLLSLTLAQDECLSQEQVAVLSRAETRLTFQFSQIERYLENSDLDWYLHEDAYYLFQTLEDFRSLDCIICDDVLDLLSDTNQNIHEQMSEVYPGWEDSDSMIASAVLAFTQTLLRATPTCRTPYIEKYVDDPNRPDIGFWEPPQDEAQLKIINGSRVSSSRLSSFWPFIVSAGGCTGSLITGQCVLSARHCGSTSSVRIASQTRSSGGTRVSVSGRTQHSSLDIHILRLSSRVSSSAHARARVANYSASVPSFDGRTGWAGGFGATSTSGSGGGTLREVQVRMTRRSRDRIDVRPTGSGTGGPLWGDSGGPLMFNGVQVGTVRGGDGSGIRADYVNTERLGSWIRSVCG